MKIHPIASKLPHRLHSAALAVMLASLLAPALSATEPGFTSLFNGRDLAGWDGNPAIWSVEDGAITGRTSTANPISRNTFLIWQGGEVKNFELRARFRFMSENPTAGNSGIQYRSRIEDAANWVVGGYQGDFNAEGRYVGLFYEELGRGILAQPGQQVTVSAGTAERPAVEVIGSTVPVADIRSTLKHGEWVDYTILAIGNHLRHYVNGRLATEVFDLDPAKAATSGIVALQAHTGPPMVIQFKDIRIKQLP